MHRTHIDRKFCEEEYEVSVVSSMEKHGQFRYILTESGKESEWNVETDILEKVIDC